MNGERVWTGDVRREYGSQRLSRKDLVADPIVQFGTWYEDGKSTVLEPNAMSIATADAQGRPSSRMVLMKSFDSDGIVFATSYESRKARQLSENPYAALLFYWPSLERQVRIEGVISKTSEKESDEIFMGRSRKSRIAARISHQSSAIENRETLEELFKEEEERLANEDPERLPVWGGYRLEPALFEFWQGGADRLHDRFLYSRDGDAWTVERLQP